MLLDVEPLNTSTTNPLAWLPVDTAQQLQATDYLLIAILAAWVWDFLITLDEECLIIGSRKFNSVTLVYIMARLSSFISILFTTIFSVGRVRDCTNWILAIGITNSVAYPAGTYLMLVRLRAVYENSRSINFVFTAIWLASCAGSLYGGIRGAPGGFHVGDTQKCIESGTKVVGSLGIIISTVGDSLIFLAISHRMLAFHTVNGRWTSRIRAFLWGDGFSHMSRLLLQTGQLYYLVTVGMNIFTTINIIAPSFSPILHAVFTVPNYALSTVMACRVFRKLKLGMLVDVPTTHSRTTSSIRIAPPSDIRTCEMELTEYGA